MKKRHIVVLLPLLFLLTARGVAQLPVAPDDRVQRAAYRAPEPTSITLMTVVANGSNSAGHSALLINASQRVIYDPAGTWYHRDVPERADLLYGLTPKLLQYYLDYHARKEFRVILQTKIVSPQVAEMALQQAIASGASMNGMCAQNTSSVLSRLPGFEGFPVGLWPKDAIKGMAAIPGVTTREEIQYDEGKDLKT